MYRERGISETKTVLEQKTAHGWRKASYDSIGYRDWISRGFTPAILPFTPPPAPVPPSLEEVKRRQQAVIAGAWKHDIEEVGMPLEGYSFTIDYDIKDALIWENSLSYLPPEATEVEIRAKDNTFHTIPRTLFETVPQLQKNYYASQLQRKWTLQKAITAATTVEAAEAILW